MRKKPVLLVITVIKWKTEETNFAFKSRSMKVVFLFVLISFGIENRKKRKKISKTFMKENNFHLCHRCCSLYKLRQQMELNLKLAAGLIIRISFPIAKDYGQILLNELVYFIAMDCKRLLLNYHSRAAGRIGNFFPTGNATNILAFAGVWHFYFAQNGILYRSFS